MWGGSRSLTRAIVPQAFVRVDRDPARCHARLVQIDKPALKYGTQSSLSASLAGASRSAARGTRYRKKVLLR